MTCIQCESPMKKSAILSLVSRGLGPEPQAKQDSITLHP